MSYLSGIGRFRLPTLRPEPPHFLATFRVFGALYLCGAGAFACQPFRLPTSHVLPQKTPALSSGHRRG